MALATDFTATYGATDYKRECRALAAYDKWAEQFRQPDGWTVIPASAKPRGIAETVDNAMRSRVERYGIFTNPPECFGAYIGDAAPNGMGVERQMGRTYPLTVWTGERIGYATLATSWRVRSFTGSHMFQIYAWITGVDGIEREYTGRGFGVGMFVGLRQTAESKRKAA